MSLTIGYLNALAASPPQGSAAVKTAEENPSNAAFAKSRIYNVAIANRVLFRGLYFPPMAHYRLARLPPNQQSVDDESWAKNWMNQIDPMHVMFLASDFETIDRLVSQVIAQGNTLTIYQEAVVPMERLAEKRFNEYWDLAQSKLKSRRFDFKDLETIEADPNKMGYAADGNERGERIRKNLEAQLVSLQLSGKSEAAAVEKLSIVHQSLRSRMSETFSNRNDQVSRFLESFLHTLDPHSSFMAPAAAREFQDEMAREIFGIGALIGKNDADEMIVQKIDDNSPAQKGGLQVGDLILGYFDDAKKFHSFSDMAFPDAISCIRGEKNTSLDLQVQRSIVDVKTGEASTQEIVATMVRGPVSQDPNRARATIYSFGSQNIAVIGAKYFYGDANGDLKKGISQDIKDIATLMKKKVRVTGVVIDLSGNGGGLLDEAVRTAGLFVKTASIAQTANLIGRKVFTRTLRDNDSSRLFHVPTLVKIDGGSASASEIVAAALQDLGVALVVGESASFGKGTIQEPTPALDDVSRAIFRSPMPNAGQDLFRYGILKLTVGAFYRITGASTQFEGVKSDLPLYPEGVSFYREREKTMAAALKPDSISAVDDFDPKAPRDFDEKLRAALASLNQERLAKNREIQLLTADAAEVQTKMDRAIHLNLNDRIDERARDLEKRKTLVKTLEDTHQIPGLKVAQIAFDSGIPVYKEINGIEDTAFANALKYSKSEEFKLAVRLAYEHRQAEIEAILPIFSDIERLKTEEAKTATK